MTIGAPIADPSIPSDGSSRSASDVPIEGADPSQSPGAANTKSASAGKKSAFKPKARSKVTLDFIEDEKARMKTFYRRKDALFKKARELAQMTDCDLMIVASANCKSIKSRSIYTFASNHLRPMTEGAVGKAMIERCIDGHRSLSTIGQDDDNVEYDDYSRENSSPDVTDGEDEDPLINEMDRHVADFCSRLQPNSLNDYVDGIFGPPPEDLDDLLEP
eukprot:Partr_v1_DN29001_c0_g1_i2_m58831